MTVTTANTGVNNSSTIPSTATKKSATDDRDTFLLLLTTQLKNQDPTSPADTNQVTQQIAALSQVEQQTKTNTYLEQLVGLFNQSQANDAVNYIGKQIDASGNTTELKNKQAFINYELPAGASKAEINISDSSGKLVYSGLGTTIAGRNTVIWDGKSSFLDNDLLDGVYTFEVKAKDAAGKDVAATPIISGLVRAIETKDGKQSLSLGGYSVPLDSLLSVYTPGTV